MTLYIDAAAAAVAVCVLYFSPKEEGTSRRSANLETKPPSLCNWQQQCNIRINKDFSYITLYKTGLVMKTSRLFLIQAYHIHSVRIV